MRAGGALNIDGIKQWILIESENFDFVHGGLVYVPQDWRSEPEHLQE
jgi:hypothetical protein